MADETTKPKSNMLLWLGAAGVGAYFFLNKSTTTTTKAPADSWLNTPLTDTSTGTTPPAPSPTTTSSGVVAAPVASTVAALVAAATAAAPATSYAPSYPDGIAQLAQGAGMSPADVLTIAQWDAMRYGHPNDLSTSYFLNDKPTWDRAVQVYRDNVTGAQQLAQRAGQPIAKVLAFLQWDAERNNHSFELSTPYFLRDQKLWNDVWNQYPGR